MIASKQDSTVSTPYRSNSSPSRRAPIRQAAHSASRSAARLSGIRELRVMMVRAARLGRPASQSLIGGTIRPSSKTLVAEEGIEPGTAPPMSSWWPNAWTNADHRARCREHRHRDAQVGQVTDAALGAVDVVVEEHVARPHLLHREVAGDRVHERGVGAAGELAQQPVVDAGAEVVGVADHRAATGAGDRGLDLHLDAGQRALDDLDQDWVGARTRVAGEEAEREVGGDASAHGRSASSRSG